MNPLAALAALAALQGNPAMMGAWGAPGQFMAPGGGTPLAPMNLPRAVVRIDWAARSSGAPRSGARAGCPVR